MQRLKVLGLALVAVFAISAVASGAAYAASTNNPQWGAGAQAGVACVKVGIGRGSFENAACTIAKAGGEWELLLENGKTIEVTAKAKNVQKLSVPGAGVTIACKKYALNVGAKVIGSAAPAAGTDEETIKYEECEVEGKPTCEINKAKAGKATITTEPLTSTLVFETKAAAENEESKTNTLFEPKAPATIFTKFELKKEAGGACPAGSEGVSEVEGQVAVQNVEGNVHKKIHVLNAPAAAIKEYFVNAGGVTKKEAVKELKLKGIIKFAATYVGESEVENKNLSEGWIFN